MTDDQIWLAVTGERASLVHMLDDTSEADWNHQSGTMMIVASLNDEMPSRGHHLE